MRGGEQSNEESREAEDEGGVPSGATNSEENASGASSDSQRASESQSGELEAHTHTYTYI